jgi:hypothetical protein
MRMGLGLGVGAVRRGGGGAPAFDPATVGWTYDVSDLSTMFQDAAQTVPVTTVSDPVRVVRDKSAAALHLVAPSDAARPLLAQDGSGRYYLNFPTITQQMATASTVSTTTPVLIAGLVSFGTGISTATAMMVRLFASATALFGLGIRASLMSARAQVRIDSSGVASVIPTGATSGVVVDDLRVHHADCTPLLIRRGIDGVDNDSLATTWDAQTLPSAAFQLVGFTDAPWRFYAGCLVSGTSAVTRKAEVIEWLSAKK